MSRLYPTLGTCLLLLAGCSLHPVSQKIDAVVCDLAERPRDPEPLHPDGAVGYGGPTASAVSADDVPGELAPGGAVPPIKLPPVGEGKANPERAKALDALYPALPDVGDDPPAPPGPLGRPLSLADVQKLALANNPGVKQAAARVEEARGAAIQAGLAPNPTVGFEADTVGTGGGPGYVGGFVEQTIKTGNKLQLSRAVAAMDLRAAELSLFDTQADLATKVRGLYFAVLVAQESVRLNAALSRFSAELYRVQVEQVKRGGFAAAYEPMYLRALAAQARAALVQSRNRRIAAWKQLAAAIGLTGMPPAALAGRLDGAVPVFEYEKVLAAALSRHADVRTAEARVQQAMFHLELARVTPVPDVNVRVMVQRDYTTSTKLVSPSVAVGVPIPVWDRNQGNILSAQAALVRQREEMHRVRNDLSATLAEAFERYKSNRSLLAYYRDGILPDLVRAYRGVYARYLKAGDAAFTDVVVAQQNLAQAVAAYLTALGSQWQAVVDVADLLQTPDLFKLGVESQTVADIPDLDALPPLTCCHACSPLCGAHHRIADAAWPNVEPLGVTMPKVVIERKTPEAPPEELPAPKREPKEPANSRAVPLPPIEG